MRAWPGCESSMREYTADGRLTLSPYLLATIRHRETLMAGKITLAEVAAKEKVNPSISACCGRR